MNNFTMKLSKLPEILSSDESDLNTRYVETLYGKEKEIKSIQKCCICNVNFWVSTKHTYFFDGFKVIDARAYENGVTPDYLKISNVLKECHWDCKNELQKQQQSSGQQNGCPIFATASSSLR